MTRWCGSITIWRWCGLHSSFWWMARWTTAGRTCSILFLRTVDGLLLASQILEGRIASVGRSSWCCLAGLDGAKEALRTPPSLNLTTNSAWPQCGEVVCATAGQLVKVGKWPHLARVTPELSVGLDINYLLELGSRVRQLWSSTSTRARAKWTAARSSARSPPVNLRIASVRERRL